MSHDILTFFVAIDFLKTVLALKFNLLSISKKSFSLTFSFFEEPCCIVTSSTQTSFNFLLKMKRPRWVHAIIHYIRNYFGQNKYNQFATCNIMIQSTNKSLLHDYNRPHEQMKHLIQHNISPFNSRKK